ncbi:MAG: hypothetical protein ACI8WT_003998 [Clostridium sp.]|jgi:hypothetical protein
MYPNKDQLRYTIKNGNDKVDNILLLKANGEFTLFQGAGGGAVQNLNYVTRWATFDAEDDYVGINASKDEKFLDDTIMRFAKIAWEINQIKGRTQITNLC